MDTVRKLSAGATIEEILEAIVIAATIRRGEEAADAGRVVSHDEVKKRLTPGIANSKRIVIAAIVGDRPSAERDYGSDG